MSDDIDSPPFTPPSSPTKVNTHLLNGAGTVATLSAPFLIGVAGGTASGKTSVCKNIMEQLGQLDTSQKRVVMLSQDSFYKKLDLQARKLANKGEYNFDHPGEEMHKFVYVGLLM